MPAIQKPSQRAARAAPPPASGFSSGQKVGLMLAAALCGPAVLKKFYDEPEKVDLSSFNMVTSYDTPAIEKLDSTLRIEFCAS